MTGLSQEESEGFLKEFLKLCRESVEALPLSELPPWLRAARVRYGWVDESLVAVFEEVTDHDDFKYLGLVGADIVVIFDMENYYPTEESTYAPAGDGFVVVEGEYGPKARVTINFEQEYPVFIKCGYRHHLSTLLFNMFFHYSPPSDFRGGPKMARFVPFALYIHKSDVSDFSRFWGLYRGTMDRQLHLLHMKLGKYYESRQTIKQVFSMMKEKNVLVLGKDSDESSLQKMYEVKGYLAGRGYEPVMLKELAEIPQWSNEEKVRAWGAGVRFSVVIDIEPSGHLAEFEMLKQQRVILAVLRPKVGGSTYMIGDEHLTDMGHVNFFEFHKSPLDVMDAVISWAEGLTSKRADAYNRIYPWRH